MTIEKDEHVIVETCHCTINLDDTTTTTTIIVVVIIIIDSIRRSISHTSVRRPERVDRATKRAIERLGAALPRDVRHNGVCSAAR